MVSYVMLCYAHRLLFGFFLRYSVNQSNRESNRLFSQHILFRRPSVDVKNTLLTKRRPVIGSILVKSKPMTSIVATTITVCTAGSGILIQRRRSSRPSRSATGRWSNGYWSVIGIVRAPVPIPQRLWKNSMRSWQRLKFWRTTSSLPMMCIKQSWFIGPSESILNLPFKVG